VAIQTSYNFKILVNSVDLSDHCVSLKIAKPQNANESQAAGAVHKQYRAGMGDPSIEATFRADDAVGSVNQTLRGLITPASTGVPILARRINAARSSANPEYGFAAIVSGDLMPLDDSWGEVPTITVKFCPISAYAEDSSTS
jgi:hypothetical protein